MQTIETPRLVLRDWQAGDARDLYEYASSPDVGPMAGWKPHESVRESEVIISEVFLKADDCWAIVLKSTGRVVGSVGLHVDVTRPRVKSRMLGYVLSPRYWGAGIATEAARAALKCGFEQMGLDIISVGHFPENARSKRVIEKCGFVFEGVLRRSLVIYDGTVKDSVRYSITWQEHAAHSVAEQKARADAAI